MEERGIASTIVGPVLHALATELGIDARAPSVLDLSHVPGTAADRLIEEAARRAKNESIALDIASKIPIGGLGTLDYALCTSPTLRDALRRVARYYGVVTQRVTLTLVEHGADASLTFAREKGSLHSRHWAEFGVAMVAARMKQTLGQGTHPPLTEVSFAHPAPKNVAPYIQFFGISPTFSNGVDRLSFPASLLDARLLTAAAQLAEALEEKMRALEPALDAADPFLSRVRLAIGELLDAREVALEPLAARLKLTRRTLQRELHRRGTSHKKLLDDVRRDRALALLERGDKSVTEVAYALGLTEPSAFFRAFRRWTGTSPAAFREQHR